MKPGKQGGEGAMWGWVLDGNRDEEGLKITCMHGLSTA